MTDDTDLEIPGTYAPGSAAQQIHDARETDRPLGLPIPEWKGLVVPRYRKVKLKKVLEQRRVRSLNAAIKLLVGHCEDILLRPEGRPEITLQEDLGLDVPVRFDGRLADAFGVNGSSPAATLVAMYEGNDLAIFTHAQRLLNWTAGEDLDGMSDQEVGELLGEADAAT